MSHSWEQQKYDLPALPPRSKEEEHLAVIAAEVDDIKVAAGSRVLADAAWS